KIYSSKIPPTEDNFAASEESWANNVKLLELCENIDGKGKLNLSVVNNNIGISLTETQKNQTLEEFGKSKYDTDIGGLTNVLCKMTDDTCIEGTLTCSIYKKYKNSQKPDTLENKLATSSNTELNSLLRSMI